MHDKFNRAKATYERMAGYGSGPSQARPQSGGYGGPQGYAGGHQAPGVQGQQQMYGHAAAGSRGSYDPERERRELEEQQRREYEVKWAQYQRELAEYEAAQARVSVVSPEMAQSLC